MIIHSGTLTVALVAFVFQLRKAPIGTQPIIAVLTLLTGTALVITLTNLRTSGSQYRRALDDIIRYQEIQGAVIGQKLAKAYPVARVVIVHPEPIESNPHLNALNQSLAKSLKEKLQSRGLTVSEQTMPLSDSARRLISQAEQDEGGSTTLAEEMALIQPWEFVQAAKTLNGKTHLVVSLIEIPKSHPIKFPSPNESPKIILFNCWLEKPESLLNNTAVVGIVRVREEAIRDLAFKGKADECFDANFEFLTFRN